MEVNGADYELIKRSEKVALFSINGGRYYEVTRIYIRPKYYDAYWFHHFPTREDISGNGKEYNSDGSKRFSRLEDALVYFEKLNLEINRTKG